MLFWKKKTWDDELLGAAIICVSCKFVVRLTFRLLYNFWEILLKVIIAPYYFSVLKILLFIISKFSVEANIKQGINFPNKFHIKA
jgi:hypothetical protein